jgi:hypothetical protein
MAAGAAGALRSAIATTALTQIRSRKGIGVKG